MHQEVLFLTLLCIENLILFCLSAELRIFFTVLFLVLHVVFEVMFPEYSSDYLSIWLYGITGHLIIRDILPLYFWAGFNDLLACRILWGGIIHIRLVVHYVQITDILNGKSKDILKEPSTRYYKAMFAFLMIDQLLIFLPLVFGANQQVFQVNLDGISILNLFGNSLYAFLIYYFIKNFYLSLSSYFIYWIDGMDLFRGLIITAILLLIKYEQSTPRPPLPMDHQKKEEPTKIEYNQWDEKLQAIFGSNQKDNKNK
jgi:hypothetical protein